MTRGIYCTGTTLDGFLADEEDSLDWLTSQDIDPQGPMGHEAFMEGIGAMVMGATTYRWIGDHMAEAGDDWYYDIPCFVFTHGTPDPLGEGIQIVSGPPAEHHAEVVEAAGERDIWVVGGGDLAAQWAEAGYLHEIQVSIAPVTLGTGRPLLPRPFDLELTRVDRNRAFVCAWYRVVGAR